VARKARTWKGARTPQALKRVRQSLRRRSINQRTRSNAKTLVVQASNIALGRSEGDGAAAVTAAISALDKEIMAGREDPAQNGPLAPRRHRGAPAKEKYLCPR